MCDDALGQNRQMKLQQQRHVLALHVQVKEHEMLQLQHEQGGTLCEANSN
jgi:hypothetical protein